MFNLLAYLVRWFDGSPNYCGDCKKHLGSDLGWRIGDKVVCSDCFMDWFFSEDD